MWDMDSSISKCSKDAKVQDALSSLLSAAEVSTLVDRPSDRKLKRRKRVCSIKPIFDVPSKEPRLNLLPEEDIPILQG